MRKSFFKADNPVEEELHQEENVSEETAHKSRRIENQKRKAFQRKLNKILFVMILLFALLIWAIFNF